MPALVSSLVRVVEGTQPAEDVGAEGMCALVEVLSVLPDPRRRQGLRFELEAVLGLALAAVIAGARSYRGIAEWVADLDEPMRRRFGATRWVPSAATIRRVVLGVDPDLLDAVLSAWVGAREPDRATDLPARPAGHLPAPVAPNPGRQDRDRDRLRSHRPRLQPGNPSPARPDHPRALEHRKLRALRAGRDLRRGPIPDPHRHIRAGHGHLPERRHQPAPPRWGHHHRPSHPRDHPPTRTRPHPHQLKPESRNPAASQEDHGKIKNEIALPSHVLTYVMSPHHFWFGLAAVKDRAIRSGAATAVSYTHLRAHETRHDLVCRLLLEKKKMQARKPQKKGTKT